MLVPRGIQSQVAFHRGGVRPEQRAKGARSAEGTPQRVSRDMTRRRRLHWPPPPNEVAFVPPVKWRHQYSALLSKHIVSILHPHVTADHHGGWNGKWPEYGCFQEFANYGASDRGTP